MWKAPAFWWTPSQTLSASILWPFSCLFQAAGFFKKNVTTSIKAPFPVISVGNLVMGGAGKTPVTLALIKLFQQMGLDPVVVTHGYGGKLKGPLNVNLQHHTFEEVGDEALLLAQQCETYVASPRRNVLSVMSNPLSAKRILLLDDAHQHESLKKDLSFVVLDSLQAFGNGLIFPAGPLRESLKEGFRKASAVILIGNPSPALESLIQRLAPQLPLFKAVIQPTTTLAPNTRVVGFAGIGYPAKFQQTLRELKADVVGFQAFPDHYRYQRKDLEALEHLAQQKKALLLTTAKDRVRIPEAFQKKIQVVEIEVIFQPGAHLEQFLDHTLKKGGLP